MVFRYLVVMYLLQNIVSTRAKPDHFVTINSAECRIFGSKLIENFKCHINEENQTTKGYGFIQFQRSVSKLAISLNVRGGNLLRPDFDVFTLNFDVCNILMKVHRERFFNYFNKVVRKFANVVPICPLTAHFNYSMSGAHFEENDMPPYIPIQNYTATINFFEENRKTAHFQFKGEVLTKSAQRKKRVQRKHMNDTATERTLKDKDLFLT